MERYDLQSPGGILVDVPLEVSSFIVAIKFFVFLIIIITAIIVTANTQVLVVKEKLCPRRCSGLWKLPTGFVDKVVCYPIFPLYWIS